MKYRPTQDQVLVELDRFKTETDSGLVIPTIAQDKPVGGTVIATGRGKYTDKGAFIPVNLEPGDRVMVPWGTGHDMTIGGKMHVQLREKDIMLSMES